VREKKEKKEPKSIGDIFIFPANCGRIGLRIELDQELNWIKD
jgi:hypothetical protein